MLPTRRSNVRSIWSDPFELLHRDFDRALNNYFEGGPTPVAGYPVDIREDDESVYVDAELPGFKRDEINVTMENGVLTIEAERKIENTGSQTGQHHLNERRFTKVSRSFSLPNTVDESNVDAKLEDGVLHLSLQKREEVKPRRIEVK
jgi:HSP20 family protein